MSMAKDKELTTKDLCDRFGVTLMTINNWRKGTKRITALPFETRTRVAARGHGTEVYFLESKVKKWAKDNNVREVVR
jgi:transcriptional regulator with XRE-family HTH domain